MPRKDANPGDKEKAEVRRRAALEYRKMGMSYRAIGAKLGVSSTQAYKDVQYILKQVRAAATETAEELRQIEVERLDAALMALAPRVAKGELGAIDRWVRISESRRVLLGIDMPTKIAPTTPDGEKPYDESASVAQRITRINELLDRARARRDREGNSSNRSES